MENKYDIIKIRFFFKDDSKKELEHIQIRKMASFELSDTDDVETYAAERYGFIKSSDKVDYRYWKKDGKKSVTEYRVLSLNEMWDRYIRF